MTWVRQGDRVWYEEENVSFADQWAYYETHMPRLLASFKASRILHAPIQGGGHGEAIQIDYVIACECGSNDIDVMADFVSTLAEACNEPQAPIFLECPSCQGMLANTFEEEVECSCGAKIPQPEAVMPEPLQPVLVEYWSSPVSVRCKACGKTETLFDESKHGHDAENGFSSSSSDEGEQHTLSLAPGEQLIASFYYTDDGFEFDREAFARGEEPDGPRPEDCFTWIRFTNLGPKRSESLMDFECA